MKAENKPVVKTFLLVLQLGLTGVVTIAIFVVAGLLIKHYYHADYMLLCCILGILSASYGVYRTALYYAGTDDEENSAVSGIYDKSENLDSPDEEDPVMEDYKLLNIRREEELKQAEGFSIKHD
ncbi:MAG: AtpZ/AtpI family protein [Lachnospiraceae bacterium]|nr:AtpZ/AtpI family protein [Lachnospiraceae bacterium]